MSLGSLFCVNCSDEPLDNLSPTLCLKGSDHTLVHRLGFRSCIRWKKYLLNLKLETLIKGHHVYRDIWTPKLGEELKVRIEPDNHVDKFAVCVKKEGKIVGHLKKGASGKFADYFLFSSQ